MISRSISRPISRSISRAIAGSANADAGFLSLDFVSNTYNSSGVKKQFGELVEFRRPSGGGIWNAQGSFEWLGSDVPRFNFDPVSGSALGLLVEPQSTNYAINSELLNGETGYSKPLATTQEAFGRGFSRGWSVPKAVSGNYAYHRASSETGQTLVSAFVKYPRTPVVSVTASASSDVVWRPVSTSSIKVENYGGLYRLSGQRDVNQTLWGLVKYEIALDGIPVVSGFQEERERITSYIPTTTAQVTRAADNVFIPNGPWRSPTGRLEVDADEGVTVTLETGGIRIAGLGHIRSLKFYPEVV
ncbi:phage head spike fiber domain-containing protein [Pseudomonas reactans]